MANTKAAPSGKKNTKAKTTNQKAKVDEPIKVDAEKEALKSELEALKAQMALMQKAMLNNAVIDNKPTNAVERNITFINLSTGTLVFRGSKLWRLEGQYKKQTVMEREARLIVNNNPRLIESGVLYIADSEFVKANDLQEIYTNLLTDKDLEHLFQQDPAQVVNWYNSVSDGQKRIIEDMIKNKIYNKERIDANILVDIGNLCGIDFMSIEPLKDE